MSDERLPFPIRGNRRGEDAPAGAESSAARLLYVVNLFAKSANVPVFAMSHDIPGGRVHAWVNGPLAYTYISGVPEERKSPPPDGDDTRLVWVPEGFVITPRTAEAPAGFGMPPTVEGAGTLLDPLRQGKGTPGGPLTQVIINKYVDNQYPDALYKAQGTGDTDYRMSCAPFFFMDWERDQSSANRTLVPPEKLGTLGVGMDTKKAQPPPKVGDKWEWGQQFDAAAQSRWSRNFREQKGPKWLCHRPMHAVGYMDAVRETILKETNLLRETEGMPPLSPPLRGTEGVLSDAILYQMDYAGQIEHDHPDYRVGYKEFDIRYKRREGAVGGAGENLFATVSGSRGADLGVEAVDWWRASPGHYDNMVNSWGDDFWALKKMLEKNEHKLHATLDPAVRTGASLPSLSTGLVTSVTQIFHSREVWVYPSLPTRKGGEVNAGGLRHIGPSMQYFGWLQAWYEGDLDRGEPGADKRISTDMHIFINGRAMRFRTPEDNRMLPLAVTVAKVPPKPPAKTTRQVIRMCVLEAFKDFAYELANGADRAVIIYEGDAADFLATRTEVGRYVMNKGQPDMSTPRFSASGDRLVFSYAELTVPETTMQCLRGMWPSTELSDLRIERPPLDARTDDLGPYTWGDELHFVEWVYGRDSGFLEVATDSLRAQVEFTPREYEVLGMGTPTYEWAVEPESSPVAYQSTVDGQCKLFADYDEEKIVYLSIKVQCSHQWGTATGEDRGVTHVAYDVKQKGTLIFPDKTELVYQDRHIRPYDRPYVANTVVEGFFSHLCHLDILRPELTVLLRHQMGFESRQVPYLAGHYEAKWSSVDTLWLGKKKLRDMGEVLKQPFLSAPDYSYTNRWSGVHKGAMFPYELYREYRYPDGPGEASGYHDSIGFVQDTRSVAEIYANVTPIRPFTVSVVSPTIFHYNQEDFGVGAAFAIGQRAFGDSLIRSDDFLLVGPLFLSGITGFSGRARNQRAEVVVYDGEYIVAGCVQRPFPATESTFPLPQYYWDSSLDLKAITGLELDDNILPIGVL